MAETSSMTESRSMWAFGTREVVYGAIGAALYGVLSYATNFIPLPSVQNVSFRPAVAVLIFFGVAYGPWVGLIAGLVGNTLGDALSGWGLFWNWSVANALMGFIAGFAVAIISDYRSGRGIGMGLIYGTLGIAIGMLFAALTEIPISGIDLSTALIGVFTPAFLGNFVVTLILLPILMVAYAAVLAGRGR